MNKCTAFQFTTFTIIALFALLWGCTTKVPVQLDPDELAGSELSVSGIRAEFNSSENKVVVSWNAVDGADGYVLFRTSDLTVYGNPDTSRMVIIGSIKTSSQTQFEDVPGISNTIYYYAIRATKVIGEDTLLGRMSPRWPDFYPCQVGTKFRFYIDRGSLYVSSRLCTLFVEDSGRVVSKVQFTQKTHSEVKDTSGNWIPYTSSTVNDPKKDPYGQLRVISRSKFIKKSTTNLEVRNVPDFGEPDGSNTTSVLPVTSQLLAVPWTLPAKAGVKFIYAKIYYSNDSVVVTDFIATYPHRVEVTLSENQFYREFIDIQKNQSTTISIPAKILYFPTIKFGIKNYSDQNIDLPFDVWIACDSSGYLADKMFDSDASKIWLQSKPQTFSLTGVGELHNTDTVYEYCFDPSRSEAATNLSALTIGKKSDSISSLSTGSVESNFNKLINLAYNSLNMGDVSRVSIGKKQFLLMGRFKDTEFDDSLLTVFGYIDTGLQVRTYLDVYPPATRFQTSPKSLLYMDSNTVISAPFTFAVKGDTESVCIMDGGFSDIRALKLVIARKPDNVTWTSDVKKAMTISTIFAMRHDEFEYPIGAPNYFYPAPVQWEYIDPSKWVSGKYVLGLVSQDEFGRWAFVTAINDAGTVRNPLFFEVRTGN